MACAAARSAGSPSASAFGDRPVGPLLHVGQVDPVQAVGGQLDGQRPGLRCPRSRARQDALEPRRRRLLAAEQALHPRGLQRQLRRDGCEGEAGLESGVAVAETAERGQCLGPLEHEMHALLVRSGVRQEPHRRLVPAGSGRRRSRRRLIARGAQQGHRLGIALARRALDVMRPHGERAAPLG